MKKISKQKLNKIFITTSKSGFTVWIIENGVTHWVIDGSILKETGVIKLGNKNLKVKYDSTAIFDEEDNEIRLVKNKK